MKALCRVYAPELIEWTKKDTGELKRMWKQGYDLDQGNGVRTLQTEFMHMQESDVWPSGEYEVDFFLEKDRKGFLVLKVASKRVVKPDARPQAVAG
ncbi:MAG: hypothetical protein ACYCSH_08780 [Acidithiobacillus sp.]